jgi:hypothetical protein
MKRIVAAQLAGAISQVSNVGLDPQKGLRLYRFYTMLKGVQTEIVEYERKLIADYDIKKNHNNSEVVAKYNEALAAICEEEVILDVDPFLTEEECMAVLGKVLTMEGMAIVLPLITSENL